MAGGIQLEQPNRDGSREVPSTLQSRRGSGWARRALGVIAVAVALASGASIALAYYGTDDHWLVGYSPTQPVDFSHKLHAGELRLDCRYCHTAVERGPMAGIPSTSNCMTCHAQILSESVKLLPVRATFAENRPIAWVRVTRLPEFTYFDHSAHLVAGVGCSTCPGRVDLMVRTEQAFSLSMGFCLDCHRNPTQFIRDVADVTNMTWVPGQRSVSTAPANPTQRRLTPALHCSGCHR